MEKAHGAVFCLRFSRIGTLGLAFSLLLPFIELLVLGLCFSNLSFFRSRFLDTYGVPGISNHTRVVSVVGLARSLCMESWE